MERAYPPGTLVRVLLNAHPCNVPSKLEVNYSGLFEVVETPGSLLTLRELDTQRVFTANDDAVRRSTVMRPAVPPTTPAARTAPLPPVVRAAPQLPPQQTAYPSLPAPSTVHRQSASRVAQLKPAQSAPRSQARAIRDIRDVSPLPPFGSPAVLPQQPPRRSTVWRKEAPQHSYARRSAVGANSAEHTSAPPTAANGLAQQYAAQSDTTRRSSATTQSPCAARKCSTACARSTAPGCGSQEATHCRSHPERS